MRIAICPGSYDPVTYGHINIIARSVKMFDKVIVTVMYNPEKENPTFTHEERVDMLREALADIPNVEVDACGDKLVAEYAREKGACALIKGLRAMSDFEYEFQMALINKKLNPELETIFITTDVSYMFLSSSAVREVARYGGDLSEFVPPGLANRIHDRLCSSGQTRKRHGGL